MALKRPSILLIVQAWAEKIGTIAQHIDALELGLDADVFKIDCAAAGKVNLDLYDIVILHYSLVIVSNNYVSDQLREKLGRFSGLTILFIQDEYRWIDQTSNALRDMDVNVVFSLVSPDAVRKVYHHPWCKNIRFEHTLTGYVPEKLALIDVPKFEDREINVGYRARKLSAWYGSHSQQKWQIADRFLIDARKYKLKVDISTDESARIYGENWTNFLLRSQAVLGTESGASVCDFSGEIQKNVEAHLARFPEATYEELRKLYFAEEDGKIVMNLISPRCFEAACLRNLMIMYPGEYGGILEAGRHYVELQKDHSNIEEVVDVLRNPKRANKIIKDTFDEIVLSGRWGYRAFVQSVSNVIKEERAALLSLGPTHLDIEKSAFADRSCKQQQVEPSFQEINTETDARRTLRLTRIAIDLIAAERLLDRHFAAPHTPEKTQPGFVWRLVRPPLRRIYLLARILAQKLQS